MISNSLPLYVRLRQEIRGRVASGEWRPGDRIPTIRELGALHGVSRMTVVQALDELSREGVLIRWQGRLHLPPHDGVVLLERLRTVDGSPIGVQVAYLPEHLVPGLVGRSQAIQSLYRVLGDTYGILPTTADENYAPMLLDPDQARLLESQPGAPAFHAERVTTDQHGRLVEFAVSVMRGDRYAVQLHLTR